MDFENWEESVLKIPKHDKYFKTVKGSKLETQELSGSV
jgi:hypothetical protein